MASCDFSTREYSYDDHVGDLEMANFSLAQEDINFKIPLILYARMKSKRNITMFGSPWSAPAWMKTTDKMTGFLGQLKGKAGDKYHKAWALYFAKFIEAYKEKGVEIQAVTVQNEPTDGFLPSMKFQCMGYTAEMERDFIKEDLGPTLAARGHSDVKIIMLDDQRPFLSSWAETVLGDPLAAKYVSGIGVHWYLDKYIPATVLTETHNRFPDHFILSTEACCGKHTNKPPRVSLGDWSRGNQYSHSIIEDLSNWSTGWVDWNLSLNMEGGPNWVKNFVDSPIIVDAENGLFYKQPMFYHLGHFSKFVPADSVRIKVTANEQSTLEYVGFTTPGPYASTVVVVLNTEDQEIAMEIHDQDLGIIRETVPAFSIQTYIW